MTPHNIGKDPPRWGIWYGGARLVRDGGPVVLEGMAQAGRQRRIPEPAHRHHPHERHDPLGLLARPRRGQNACIRAAANATVRLRLACVAREPRLGREVGLGKVVSGPEDTTLVVDEGVTASDL